VVNSQKLPPSDLMYFKFFKPKSLDLSETLIASARPHRRFSNF
jgi:hypothetical protein